jgi:hypothetical protein
MPRGSLLQLRRGTAAEWTTANTVLDPGEPGFETDTNKMKVGDGATAWNSLPYTAGDDVSGVESVTGDGVDNTDPDNPVISFPDAGDVAFTPSGNISALTVEDALEELDGEKQAITEKNQPNGYAGLGGDGKVQAAQLPSYVDDVLEYANLAAFPVTGEVSKIYIALDTNWEYRWSGSTYIRIVASPGTTDEVPEGSTNQYFTATRVRAVVLTGISFVTNSAILATDTLLVAFGKLQAQLTAIYSTIVTYLTVRDSKTASYTLQASDSTKTLTFDSSSDIVITVPVLVANMWVTIINKGTGGITFIADTGATVTIAGSGILRPLSVATVFYDTTTAALVLIPSTPQDSVRTISVITTQTPNATTVETNLLSYTVRSNTLGVNGESAHVVAMGRIIGNANSKTLKVYLGATTLLDTGALAIAANASWVIKSEIIRVTSTSQKIVTSVLIGSTVLPSTCLYVAGAENLATDLLFRVTGTGVATNDMYGEAMKLIKAGI